MKTLDELDALHAAADSGPWKLDRQRTYARAAGPGEWVTRPIAIDYSNGPRAALPNLFAIVALHNAWPSVSARLRAAEAVLRALVACDDAIGRGEETPTSRHDLAEQARAALGEP